MNDHLRPTIEPCPGTGKATWIIGTGRSAIGTVVERTTRFTMLVHLPRKDGWGDKERVKMAPRWAATALNRCVRPSPMGSPSCPTSSGDH